MWCGKEAGRLSLPTRSTRATRSKSVGVICLLTTPEESGGDGD